MTMVPYPILFFGSAIRLASQRLPRWLGPPVVSRIRFQSVQPVVQCKRSSRMSMPMCSARCDAVVADTSE